MKISSIQPFILHVPVTRSGIADSTHSITHWGAPGVIVETSDGVRGHGYTGTHGHLALDRLIVDCISNVYAPLLVGEELDQIDRLWRKLHHFPPAQWVGRAGITHLALSAVDIALWDIKAKQAGLPLWALLNAGSGSKKLVGYNTDGGWLNWSLSELEQDCRRLVMDEGYPGVKIKVGSIDAEDDLRRIEAARNAIGPDAKLMVDANGKWDLDTAIRIGGLFRDFDVYWFEEPLWYDDLQDHVLLGRSIETPIALGEQLYMPEEFRNFVEAQAVRFVQPDCVRLAGITEWLEVAEMAHDHGLPVCAHIGDMMQVHLHLSLAHPACEMLEYIPWMRDCFVEPATVSDGVFVRPELPGAGTTLRDDAIERFGVL